MRKIQLLYICFVVWYWIEPHTSCFQWKRADGQLITARWLMALTTHGQKQKRFRLYSKYSCCIKPIAENITQRYLQQEAGSSCVHAASLLMQIVCIVFKFEWKLDVVCNHFKSNFKFYIAVMTNMTIQQTELFEAVWILASSWSILHYALWDVHPKHLTSKQFIRSSCFGARRPKVCRSSTRYEPPFWSILQ